MHRRDRKRGKVEEAPIFHQPHIRSESEISHAEEEYATPQSYTPPMPRTPSDGSPRPTAPLMAGESPRPEKLEERLYENRRSPVPSPTPSQRNYLNASPSLQRMSYYSASNIPPPSPLPEPSRYHSYTRDSSARSTTAYGTEPPMSAVSYSTVTYNQSPSSPTHLSPPPSATLQVPGRQQQQRAPSPATPAEQYEMHVRTPTSDQWVPYPQGRAASAQGMHTPMATEDSYATARDEYDPYDAYDGYVPQAATSQTQHQQEESWRSSTYSYSGPHAI